VINFTIFAMKSNKSMHLILLVGALLSLVIVSTMNPNFVLAQGEKFKAKLKGESEVPPVTSAATGKAKFKVKDDTITSNINITGITDITMAHIHAGINGQNGEPVVDLLKTGNQNKTEGGIIIKGEIKASDLQGPMAGKTLQDLQTAMGDEKTYVNIHTGDHPDGEIRGQIKVSGGNATSADSLVASSTAGTDEG
jgi:CHRD domain